MYLKRKKVHRRPMIRLCNAVRGAHAHGARPKLHRYSLDVMITFHDPGALEVMAEGTESARRIC